MSPSLVTRLHGPAGGVLRVGICAGVLLVSAAVGLRAASQHPGQADPGVGGGSHAHHVAQVRAAGLEEYRRILDRYDAHLRLNGGDVVAAVERCRFIEAFIVDEEGIAESAFDDHEHCVEDLGADRYAQEPVAQVYRLEQQWGEEGIAFGEQLVASSGSWPPELRAVLHAHLAFLHRAGDDEARAGPHALRAVGLDPGSRALLVAAAWLERRGAKDRARTLIASAPADVWERLSASEAAALLVRVGEPAAAVALLRDRPLAPEHVGGQVALARALLASNDVASARGIYLSILEQEQPWRGPANVRAYFELEREHGAPDEAVAAYQRLRDHGYVADPFARYRLDLLIAHPLAGWTVGDGLGILAFLSALAFFGLLPLVVTMPVHYYSLARRVRGVVRPAGALPWGLGHAWYALALLLVAGMVGHYLFAYPDFEDTFALAPFDGELSDDRALARAALFGAVVMIGLVFPLLRGTRGIPFVEGAWPLRRSLHAATGLALAFRVASSLVLSLPWFGVAALGGNTTRALQGVYAEFGLAALLLFAAVVVPVLEELIFRGVLLNSLSRHVPVRAAAVIQAVVFAALHDEGAAMPLLFLFGLIAAWLARRSQGLIAPILFHAFWNALACLGIVMATNALNAPGG